MNRFAVIENGKVINIAASSPEFAAEQGWIECPDGVGIGYLVDDKGQFSAPPPDPVIEAAKVRARRDQLLVESDVYVLPDRWATMTSEKQSAWAAYRQALRDIPDQAGFPLDVQWPNKPE